MLLTVLRKMSARVNGICFVLAGAILVIMIAHIMIDATLRLFGVMNPFQAIVVVAAWYMVAVVFLSMPRTARSVGHITVDILTDLMPQKWRKRSRVFVHLITIAYLALLGVLNIGTALHRTQTGEVWETATGYIPVWPSRWLVPLAFVLVAIVYLLWLGKEPEESSENGGADNER